MGFRTVSVHNSRTAAQKALSRKKGKGYKVKTVHVESVLGDIKQYILVKQTKSRKRKRR